MGSDAIWIQPDLGSRVDVSQVKLTADDGKAVAKLTAGSNGALDEADYEQTVKTLLSAVSAENPAITKEPEGAWTHAITDKALN